MRSLGEKEGRLVSSPWCRPVGSQRGPAAVKEDTRAPSPLLSSMHVGFPMTLRVRELSEMR